MNELIGRVFDFQKSVFPNQSALYANLAVNGQRPKALIVSCADSRVVPEEILQAAPGDLFVCRNAGNIVPPFSNANGGVTSTVEYAVMALGGARHHRLRSFRLRRDEGVDEPVVAGNHAQCGGVVAP